MSRWVVQVEGRRFEVEVLDGPDGLSVRLPGKEPAPTRLVQRTGPLCTLERGTLRTVLSVEGDPEEKDRFHAQLAGRAPLLVETRDARIPELGRSGTGMTRRMARIKSPMPGVIVEVRVQPGAAVERGQVLLILEAMKMQNEIRAEGQGKVKTVKVTPGATVAAGALLIEFESS